MVVSDAYNTMDCSLPGSSVHGDSPGKNTGVGCHFLLQGIFPTQGLNPAWQAAFFTHQAAREALNGEKSGPTKDSDKKNEIKLKGQHSSLSRPSDTTLHQLQDYQLPRCLFKETNMIRQVLDSQYAKVKEDTRIQNTEPSRV